MSTALNGVYDRSDLIRCFASGVRPPCLFFWGHSGHGVGKWMLSQWYPAPFVVSGVRYATAEHWMMAAKARLFGDEAALSGIIGNDDPAAAKETGRAVQGYDDAAWCNHRVTAVREGSAHKFRQNPEMGALLASTAGKVLVEASPFDTIWGIGLSAENPKAQDPSTWRGENLLGFALMWARDALAASP